MTLLLMAFMYEFKLSEHLHSFCFSDQVMQATETLMDVQLPRPLIRLIAHGPLPPLPHVPQPPPLEQHQLQRPQLRIDLDV